MPRNCSVQLSLMSEAMRFVSIRICALLAGLFLATGALAESGTASKLLKIAYVDFPPMTY